MTKYLSWDKIFNWNESQQSSLFLFLKLCFDGLARFNHSDL